VSAGLVIADLSSAGDDVVTFSSGYSGAATVRLTGDSTNSDKVTNSANIALAVLGNASDLDAATTITGGTGTDTITLTADNDAIGATTTSITSVENITVAANATTPSNKIVITMGGSDDQIGTGKTLTVNATALTDAAASLTFNGTAIETDGFLNITGGAGNDTLTGGSNDDSISGGAGADSLAGGAGRDQLSGGAGNDTITGGTGLDVITLGDGVDTVVFVSGDAGRGTALSLSNYTDKVSAMSGGVNVGDTVTGAERILEFSNTDGSGESIVLGNTNITAFTNTGRVQDNTASIVQGVYDAISGIFTVGAGRTTGEDSLLLWDSNSTVATLEIETVVLVGVNATEANYFSSGISLSGILAM
jgi:Ca2+-binding RTX toxin-like protein